MNALALLPSLLAQVQSAPSGDDPRVAWAPVVLLLIIGIGFAVSNIMISLIVGPKRTGPGKEETYESGMVPVGDTRQRFNVRFYIVAMIFLVFDVDIVFMYPWATIFAKAARPVAPNTHATLFGADQGAVLLIEMVV